MSLGPTPDLLHVRNRTFDRGQGGWSSVRRAAPGLPFSGPWRTGAGLGADTGLADPVENIALVRRLPTGGATGSEWTTCTTRSGARKATRHSVKGAPQCWQVD